MARIIVQEDGAMAFGSGTLVGVKDQHGLVVTNWHVVRDAAGPVEVVFPDGFRSHARPLKVDSDWDLAALVIWRPAGVEPVKIAARPPRPGELLTIHGYGRGKYRIATGHCTNYYSPQPRFPHEMVELDVEARQGDSGGPILNQCGELAGVLFGAGQGTTMGSFAPRVRYFLSAVAPNLEQTNIEAQIAAADRPAPVVNLPDAPIETPNGEGYPSAPWAPSSAWSAPNKGPWQSGENLATPTSNPGAMVATKQESSGCATDRSSDWFESAKTILATIGLAAITLRLVRFVR